MKESIMFILVTIVLALLTMALLDVDSRIDELESSHTEWVEIQGVTPDSADYKKWVEISIDTVYDFSKDNPVVIKRRLRKVNN